MSDAPDLLRAHHLKKLKLPTVLREYERQARQCAAEGRDHVQFLLRLVELELIDRERRMVERRIKAAKVPAARNLDSFDFTAIPALNKAQVLELARCGWIERRENVIMPEACLRHDALGPAGTGKTHIGLGLGLAACQRGLPVRFTTAAALVHVPIFEALMQARRDILTRIAALDSQIRATARQHATVRLLMTAPGVGPITAMAVVAAFDDAARFRRSSSVGAYLGLTPRRYESGEISRNGRVSKRGDRFTRKCLYEAANALFCRNLGDTRLRSWAKAVAERTGSRKAKVTLHAMWRTNTPFREAAMA